MILNGLPPNDIPNDIVDSVVECFQDELRTFNIVDCVVSISHLTNYYLQDIYNISYKNRRLIVNGYLPFEQFDIDKSEARHLMGFSNEEELLIFVGRPVVHKGVIPLMWAANVLRNTRKKLRLILCGSMQGFSKFNKVINHTASSLVFAGEISHEELPLWIRAVDVGIMPSYSEPFGYSALEMVDLGLPLVISDKVALCKYFRDGINAFVATVGHDLKDVNFM